MIIFCFSVSLLFSPVFAQHIPGKISLANRFVSTINTDTTITDSEEYELNNWLDLNYRYKSWAAGVRFEIHNPRNTQYSDKITQRYIEYRGDWLKIRTGNFYERLGRGLIFHAFEIQGQTIDRTEQNIAIDRNIDGVKFEMSFDRFEVNGIWGRALKMLSSERSDPLGGGEIQFRPNSMFMFGGSFLQLHTENFRRQDYRVDFRSAEIAISSDAIDFYSEFAQKKSTLTSAEADGNAIYASANFIGEWLGLSAEFKRYEDFSSSFNNPPTLVKTHSFVLLNRHTHTLNANNESGYQFEGYITPSSATTITIHASGADNLENNPRRRFREYFIESYNEWNERLTSRVLFDYSKDRPVGDLNRQTAAAEVDYILDKKNSMLFDTQVQHIENENSGKYWNYLTLFAYSRSPWLTLSLQHERTTKTNSLKKKWTSAALNLKIGQRYDFLLTAGARPAGLVCSGGICFFVPEFEGIELRWYTRF